MLPRSESFFVFPSPKKTPSWKIHLSLPEQYIDSFKRIAYKSKSTFYIHYCLTATLHSSRVYPSKAMSFDKGMLGRTIQINAPPRLCESDKDFLPYKDSSKPCALRRLPSLHTFEHALPAPPALLHCAALPSSTSIVEYQWSKADSKPSLVPKTAPKRKQKCYKVRKLARNPTRASLLHFV
jgi:hypothetical protein